CGFGAQQHAAPLRAEPVSFIDDDPGRCAAAIDIARRNHARILLSPLCGRHRLAGPSVRSPVALTVPREEPEIAVFHEKGRAARGRVVVIVVEDIAETRHRLLVAVAEVMDDGLHASAVRLHARRDPAPVPVTAAAPRTGLAARRVGNGARGTASSWAVTTAD